MRRHVLAAAAIFSFLAAASIALFHLDMDVSLGFFCRVGTIFAAAWFAYDDVQRIPSWLLLALFGAIIVAVRWPKLFFVAAPALILLAAAKRFLLPR